MTFCLCLWVSSAVEILSSYRDPNITSSRWPFQTSTSGGKLYLLRGAEGLHYPCYYHSVIQCFSEQELPWTLLKYLITKHYCVGIFRGGWWDSISLLSTQHKLCCREHLENTVNVYFSHLCKSYHLLDSFQCWFHLFWF